MSGLQELYDEHGRGTDKEFAGRTINSIREHIDRLCEICRVVHSLAPESILDAPCATGLITALVTSPERRVVGLDISSVYCDMAKEMYGVQTVCVDIRDYRPEERFDLVMGMEILEHVEAPLEIFRALVRCSKRYVLVSTPEEHGAVDGTYHVRRVCSDDLSIWANMAGLTKVKQWFLPSMFCEKPKWQGWNFLLGEVRDA